MCTIEVLYYVPERWSALSQIVMCLPQTDENGVKRNIFQVFFFQLQIWAVSAVVMIFDAKN